MRIALLIAFWSLSQVVLGVDRTKFRTCQDTLFCRTFRQPHLHAGSLHREYSVVPLSLEVDEAGGSIRCTLSDDLNLRIQALANGAIRVRVSEVAPDKGEERWKPHDVLVPGALSASPLTRLDKGSALIPTTAASESFDAFAYSSPDDSDSRIVIVLHQSPLVVELFRGDVLVTSINSRSLMHYEKTQTKAEAAPEAVEVTEEDVDRHGGKEVVDYGEDGLATYADGTKELKKEASDAVSRSAGWSESFQTHTDSKPDGPKSVGVDIAFPFAEHVYGIPQHSAPLSLPTTIAGSAGTAAHFSEPYRMYTLDVFEYEVQQTMALYGNIPLLIGHGLVGGKGVTAAVFWFNPTETFIDISDGKSSAGAAHKESHWVSESGDIDIFLLTGPSPAAVSRQFGRLVGTQALPPLFALGYHQCRWNYRDEKDVSDVDAMFERLDYPYDVLWLDIEHTHGKRYFTWDKALFPSPKDMIDSISAHGRKMVTIVDPHIKRDSGYAVHAEATSKGYYIKDKSGGDFDGWCWPGSSSYLDFTNATVREWWGSRFALDRYAGSTLDLFTWNDMNEPSVFNGPEVSMPKDCRNLAGIEHREWHNLYGMYMQQATAEGLTARDPAKMLRPFVLSRAFWAGSQRFGAIWTGDNTAHWDHLKIAAPMLLSISVAGLSFAGADVGGFFGDPDAELFTRWYQAAAFTPFFRGHAHHDSKRREPWVFGEPYTEILRGVAMQRYSLLPYWYAVFAEAQAAGLPVMRPMFVEFPDEPLTFAMDDQWMVGSSLLVKPITTAGVATTAVYLPGPEDWFDLESLANTGHATKIRPRAFIDAPISKIPVFIRGGSIVPRKMRLRRSSKAMFYDPLTLVIAPNAAKQAKGTAYFDDEHSLAHSVSGEFALRELSYDGGSIKCTAAPSSGSYSAPNKVERVVIAGQQSQPRRVFVVGEPAVDLEFAFNAQSQVLVIKKPDVLATADWEIAIKY